MKKKLFWAFILLVIISGSVLFLVGRYTDRIIDPFVRSFLEEQKPMNHRIEYKRIKVNLIKRLIKITDIRVYPDSSLVKDENIWLEVNVSTIRLTDFNIRKMLFHKELKIGDLMVLNPEVKLHLPLKPADEIVEEVKTRKPETAKAPLLKSISLDKMIFSGGTFQLIRNDSLIASSPDINFIVQQIELVKNSKADPIGYSYGDVSIYLSNIIFHSESGLYDMSLGSFSANKKDSSAVLKGFRMIPKYDKQEFSKKLKSQNDRIDLKIGKIDIERVGFLRLLAGQPLEISKILIDSLIADIYRDRNVAMDLSRFPPFYNELFLKINFPLLVDTLMVVNSNIQYGELDEGDTKAGVIQLDDFNLSTYGLSNQQTDSIMAEEMRIFLNAQVMGEGIMKVDLALPLEGNLHEFTCNGSVGAMKLSPLNDMMGPSMNMVFNDGKLNRMTFDFSASDNNSKGWMEFLYEGLDVSLLKKDPGKDKEFLSALVNAVILSDNPAPGKDLVTVEIGFERDKNKGIVNYIWKTIQSGMTRTILTQNKYQTNKK